MNNLKKFYPHILSLLGFVVISLIYFYPVLQRKQILQSDIVQYTGMAKEQNTFRATDNAEPYWTNSAFGGMPTYQLGAKYPHNYISTIDHVLRFLPRPADYLFLYFMCFYVLLLVLKTDPLKAFFGALAFGFSTYLIIILGVGHNAKAHAIAYMPLVISGFILVFRKKYVIGGLLAMFATALEVNANHFQMTYYLLLFLMILSGYFIFHLIKEKDYRAVYVSLGALAVAGIFALGANATNLLSTAEYTKFSTRGKGELTINPDGSKKTEDSALSREYITEYSYGVLESFNLIAPRIFGGSNSENLDEHSQVYDFLVKKGVPEAQVKEALRSGMPTYWGNQPIVAAPAYVGIVVFLLAVLALFIDRRKIKYVFLTGAIVALLLSWGKNLPGITDLFIDHFPLYDKFRAVSSIQVLLELCLPVLAVMGLQAFFSSKTEEQLSALWKAAAVTMGIIIVLLVGGGMFGFESENDDFFLKNYGQEFVDALVADRISMYNADLIRSGVLTIAVAGLLWMFVKQKLAEVTVIIMVGVIMVFDLVFVAKNYVSSDDFVGISRVAVPFEETEADAMILQDTTHYRVFELGGGMSNARASYFHKSISGYHAAKPRRMQELYDFHISKSNVEVLNMLNVKYLIKRDENGVSNAMKNDRANGNAWFVNKIKLVSSANDEISALKNLDTKNVAVYNKVENKGRIKFAKGGMTISKDSVARIELNVYKPNYLKYTSDKSGAGLAVFSEIYYGDGWNAYLDGKKVHHFRVNYVLRAMFVPSGKHSIEFRFEPQVVNTGSTITLISFIGMILLLAGGVYYERKNNA